MRVAQRSCSGKGRPAVALATHGGEGRTVTGYVRETRPLTSGCSWMRGQGADTTKVAGRRSLRFETLDAMLAEARACVEAADSTAW